jgi:hypothetical protein
VVLGGTLGILLATALLANNSSSGGRPLRVAVVERGQLLGRDQEWNITRSELQVGVGGEGVWGERKGERRRGLFQQGVAVIKLVERGMPCL